MTFLKQNVVVMEINYNVIIHFQEFYYLLYVYSLYQAKNVLKNVT